MWKARPSTATRSPLRCTFRHLAPSSSRPRSRWRAPTADMGARKARRARSRDKSAVRALADHLGIIAEYVDQTGKERRATSDRTRVALLAAMRFDASSERAAANALAGLRERDRERLLPSVQVTQDAATPV